MDKSIDPTGFASISLTEQMAIIAIFATLSTAIVYYTSSISGFNSQEAIQDFVDAFTYFAKKDKTKDVGGDDGDDSDNQDSEGNDRHGGGKNAQHGKEKNQPSQEKQIKELEDKLRNASGRKEKVEISNKIKNLKQEMDRRRKGENHSRKNKK